MIAVVVVLVWNPNESVKVLEKNKELLRIGESCTPLLTTTFAVRPSIESTRADASRSKNAKFIY